MPKQIKDSGQFQYQITITDKKGQPAKVDGVPVWTSSNEAVATVDASDDGMTATVKGGVPGVATISVQADADLGEGVTPLAGADDVTVVPGGAASISLVDGPETEQS